MSGSGYVPFERGARVEFLTRGRWVPGVVKAVHLNPDRAPGAGRVTYDVEFHPAYYPARCAAKRVRAAGSTAAGPPS